MTGGHDTDWRLQGQERYLTGVRLAYGPYRTDPKNPSWDHDHCEFCGTKFMVDGGPEALCEGYQTLEDCRWICSTCFTDFRDRFGWELVVAGRNE